ncbi:hypothetical protein Tco_0018559, partial [Tanacetum coccineum]
MRYIKIPEDGDASFSGSRISLPHAHARVYTRFFEYANFRLPLSTSLINMLRHYRIHISQLSVIGAAKVSHFEILCRVHGFEPTVGLFLCFSVNSKNKGWVSFSKRQGNDAVCYTKPLDSLKSWNDRFFWVDAFACPTSFPWNTSKSASKDPFPKPSQYNAEHYATLVAYPAPFHKYLKHFLCLIGISRNYTLDKDTYPQFLGDNDEEMDLLSFIRTADPTKVRVGERQRAKGEPKLLDTTVGRVVPLLPVALPCASSELEASVEKLFDEGGSGSRMERGDSVSGGHGVDIPQVSATADIVAEDAAPVQPKHQRKRKTTISDAAVLNPEVGVAALPTLPFITSSVPVTPEREDGNQSDFMAGANLRTITAPPRFIISSDSSHYFGANIAESEVDSFARPSVPPMTMATTVTSTADSTTTTKERFIEPSIFGGGSSSGAEHTVGGFSGLTGSDFIVGGIRTVVSPDTDLQKVYVPQWSVTNGSRLDDGRTCHEMVDEFAPPKFFASIRGMEHDQLFTEFNVGAARQMSLSTEVRMRAEFNIREKRRLFSVVKEKDSLLKARDEEIRSLKAQLLEEIKSLKECNTALEEEKGVLDVKVADLAATVKVREQEAADSDAIVTIVKLQNDKLADQLEKFQDEQMAVVHEKFNKLDADFIKTCLHLEERFYPHLLTTIAGRRWLLTYGMKLTVFKYLNSPEYLSALGAAISKAIEKGMQDGLAAGITHGQEGRVLADVATFNPSAEDDFTSALQEVQNVNFSLLAELQSNEDASVKTVMDLLRLDEALAERLGLNDSQPHVDQLMVPVHHSPDQTITP